MRTDLVESAQCSDCHHNVDGYPPSRCPQCGCEKWWLVGPTVAELTVVPGEERTLVITVPLARDWYKDAKHEALQDGIASRRREILFSMCFAECYLVDWVRDHVADKDGEQLARYVGIRDAVRERWLSTPARLAEDGIIATAPSFSPTLIDRWERLIRYRNALAHGRASWPWKYGAEIAAQRPTLIDLEQMASGAALETVLDMIRTFHEAAGTQLPQWIHVDDRTQRSMES